MSVCVVGVRAPVSVCVTGVRDATMYTCNTVQVSGSVVIDLLYTFHCSQVRQSQENYTYRKKHTLNNHTQNN